MHNLSIDFLAEDCLLAFVSVHMLHNSKAKVLIELNFLNKDTVL